MIVALVLLSIIIIILIFFHPLQDLYRVHFCNFPEGPWSLPIIGGIHHLGIKWPHLAVQELVKKYGRVFSIRMGPVGRIVFISDYELVNKVLENPLANDRPSFTFLQLISQNAEGIGSLPYGPKWKKITKLFRQGIGKFSQPSITEQCNHCYGKLLERFQQNSGKPYNPNQDIVQTVTMILSSIVYGERHKSLDAKNIKDSIQYHTLLMKGLNPVHPINLFSWLWHIPSPWKQKVLKMIEFRDKRFEASLDKKDHTETEEARDMMDIISDFRKEKDMDDVTLKDFFISIWTFYTAASDNVVDTLGWMILLLCANPHVQKKLQAELDAELKDGKEPSIEDKEKLSYTCAVVLETLRLGSPTAFGVPREAAADLQIDGYAIPKGTTIMLNFWGLHHDPKNWENPSEFRPERFLDKNGRLLDNEHLRKLPLLAFSRGKRPCLGRFLAKDFFFLFAARIFKNFSMRFPIGEKPDMCGQFVFSVRPSEFRTIMTPRK